jgi:hypothetical protein
MQIWGIIGDKKEIETRNVVFLTVATIFIT